MDLSGPALTLSASVFSTELIQSEAPYICSQGFSTWGKRDVGVISEVLLVPRICCGTSPALSRSCLDVPLWKGRAPFFTFFFYSSTDIHAVFLAVSLLVKSSLELYQCTQWSAEVKCYCCYLSHTPFNPQHMFLVSFKKKNVWMFLAAKCDGGFLK